MNDDPFAVVLTLYVLGAVLSCIVFGSILPLVVVLASLIGLGLLTKQSGDE